MKKLVLLGAVALVVLGCVIAAGCTSTPTTQQTTSKDTAISLPVGTWIGTNFVAEDGRTITAVQTIKADGTGYWMELNESDPGFDFVRIYTSTFSKPDQNGAFEKASSTGKSYKMVYDAAKGTITQSGDKVYTRLEPIVGIWSGISSAESGSGNATTLVKPDGTGLSYVSYANGTIRTTELTWKKNTDGTYAMDFSSGLKRTYTVASDGNTLKTDDGRTKTKQFLDTSFLDLSFLMSMPGPWYSKDKNALVVFNIDGTGFLDYSKGLLPFTWKQNAKGNFTVTYLEGTADDGSSLKGKTSEWSYDHDNDVFISGKGTTYIRPLGVSKAS